MIQIHDIPLGFLANMHAGARTHPAILFSEKQMLNGVHSKRIHILTLYRTKNICKFMVLVSPQSERGRGRGREGGRERERHTHNLERDTHIHTLRVCELIEHELRSV